MRVIAGKLKGRGIKVPVSKFTRPTTDKNREAIFNYLNNILDFNGINVCDIYAGSGSLGIEAYSRGAGKVDFVEKNYSVYKTLAGNVEKLGIKNSVRIFKTTAVRFSKMKKHETYQLVLADPPFFKNDIYLVLENLFSNNFLMPGGIVLIERSIQTEKEDQINFKTDPVKRLGDSLIYIFEQQ